MDTDPHPPRGRRVAVVLAAGEGRRFGGAKQLAPLRGRPLLRHALDAVVAHPGVDATVVVLGARAAAIRAAVDLDDVVVAVCEDWHRGPSASLRTGLEAALRAGAVEVLVTLGDQPTPAREAIDRVLAAPGDVVRAVHGERPGHPVLLRGASIRAVTPLSDDERRALFSRAAVRVAVGDVDPGADVDRPEDLRALEARDGGVAQPPSAGGAQPA